MPFGPSAIRQQQSKGTCWPIAFRRPNPHGQARGKDRLALGSRMGYDRLRNWANNLVLQRPQSGGWVAFDGLSEGAIILLPIVKIT